MPSDIDAEVSSVGSLVGRVMPLFAGKDPKVVGAALADLLATWLAGHFAGDERATRKLRDEVLRMHVGMVRQLVPENEKIILANNRRRAS